MILLDKNDIKKALSMRDAIEADKIAYQLAAEGTVENPLRTVIGVPEKDASFCFMPAYAEGIKAASVKVVNVFPHNAENGLVSTPGQVLLCDGETGYFLALLDGTYVTSLRTGASSGAAFDLLAKKECRIGALIGTGGQAAHQLEAMICARDLEEVRIYSRNKDKREAFVAQMQAELADYNTRFVAVDSSDAAIDDADLIILATSAMDPVIDGNKVKAGATVSCVGSYRPNQNECDPQLMARASKIYCDLVSASLAESGDLLIPIEMGLIRAADITGSLGDVVNGKIPARENDEEIIVFESVGIGAQDLVTAKLAYDKALELGCGIKWGE